MKTALIIGATGNFGHQMALTLLQQEWQVRVLLRDPNKLPNELRRTQTFVGSALDESLLNRASQGCDLIIYAANPKYHRWHEEALQMLEPTIEAAKQSGARILLPGNVYNYQPQATKIDESTKQLPPTDKGEIRLKMEQRLKKASEQGVKVTIIRAGDFIGPNAHFTWLNMALKHKAKRSKLSLPHDSEHKHFWSYLPDLCYNAALLVEQSQADFECWHDSGLMLTEQDWIQSLEQNGQRVKVGYFPWFFLRAAAVFSPMIKEVLKMRYLWRKTVLLDGQKMKKQLGTQMQQTNLTDIIKGLLEKSPA